MRTNSSDQAKAKIPLSFQLTLNVVDVGDERQGKAPFVLRMID